MTTSVEQVKLVLCALLDAPDVKVFALRGKWGTGKTHLWNSVSKAREFAGKPTNSVYVSLFGIKSINELKLRIVQNTYFKDASKAAAANVAGSLLASITKKVTGFSLEDSAQLMLPNLVSEKLIVIDDIERKHKSLDISELLGLIDEYSLAYKARFLLLLNTNELAEKEIWAQLHEKVIDAEVLLDPSADEAFSIASADASNAFLPELRKAVAALGITNIRVLKKIVRLCLNVEKASKNLSDASTNRWVPSTALLAAMHYRAIENAPSLSYLENRSDFLRDFEGPDTTNPDEHKWNELITKLGKIEFGVFERIVVEYMNCGIIDTVKLTSELETYKADASASSLYTRTSNFRDSYLWDSSLDAVELCAMARGMLADVGMLTPSAVSEIVNYVQELGDLELAQEFLDGWTSAVTTKSNILKIDENSSPLARGRYHPEVKNTIQAIRNIVFPPLTIVESMERIGSGQEWGEREKNALLNSTAEGYIAAIRSIKGVKLQFFMIEHIKWARDSSTDEAFLNAETNFMLACKKIYNDNPNSRLSNIIARLFRLHSFSLDAYVIQ